MKGQYVYLAITYPLRVPFFGEIAYSQMLGYEGIMNF